jgi:hypothetical protein
MGIARVGSNPAAVAKSKFFFVLFCFCFYCVFNGLMFGSSSI